MNKGDGDWLTIHFDGELLFTFGGGSFWGDGDMHVFLPVYHLRGQSGEIEFRLNRIGTANAILDLADLVFTRTSNPENALPVADAGPDVTVRLGSVVTLDGSSSFDPDGLSEDLFYFWSPDGSFDEVTEGFVTGSPAFTPNLVGEYTVSLEVLTAKPGVNQTRSRSQSRSSATSTSMAMSTRSTST